MGITLGSQPCLEPNTLRDFCAEHKLPVDWYGKPNQMVCPEGCAAGQGWVLLSRASLNALNLNAKQPLTFQLASSEINGVSSPTQTVTLKNLVIVKATCITPGMRGDPNAAYLVELADRRRLLRPIPIDKAYNVLSTPGSATYYTATLVSGTTPWTWSQMVSDIWSALGASNVGTFPGLPFTPDGTPENFNFYGSYALDALGFVLDRLSCALRLSPLTDTFSIVRIGSPDLIESATLTSRDALRVLDDDPLESALARVPQYVRTQFPIWRASPDTTGGSPWYHLDNTDPTAGGALPGTQPGTYAIVYDDLAAIYDGSNTLTNSGALSSRALERAADYFRKVRMLRLHRVYGLPLNDAGLLPGSQLKATRWGDRGRGFVTEIGQFPGLPGPPALLAGDTLGSSDSYYNEQNVWNYYGGDDYWILGGGGGNGSGGGGPTYLDFFHWLTLLYYYLSTYQWSFLGVVIFNNLTEVCAALFWCCTTATIPDASQTDAWVPAAAPGKVVIDVTSPNNGDGIIGIVPAQINGANGPQLLVLTNVGANTFTLYHNSSATSAYSILLPPTYGSSVTLAQNDSIILWWDSCTSRKWRVLACTVDFDPGVSLSTYKAYLSSPGILTSSWANVNLSLTLPAGTYEIHCDILTLLTATLYGSQSAAIQCRLYNSTDGAALADTIRQVAFNPPFDTGVNRQTPAHLTHIVTLAAQKVIDLQAQYVSVGTVSTASVVAGGGSNVGTAMFAVKVG